MKIFGREVSITPIRKQQPVQVLTKKPGFSVTQFHTNNAFQSLILNEDNYFDQYVLYTGKAIDYISNKIASSPIRLFDTKGEKEQLDNELFTDLQAFNPYMNLWEARKLVIMHKFLVGAAYWYIDRKPEVNKRAEFYPLDPTHMQIKTDGKGLPSYYIYTDADGRLIDIPREDIVYFRRMNPENWFEGQSHVHNILFWHNAYSQGAQYNMNKLGNNINVDKLIYFEGIADTEREKIEEQLQNKYGGVRNAGRTGVVNSEPKVVDVSSNQKDLDYVPGMKMLREDILASFGIPEALLFPSATNSNSKEARTLFQGDTLEPLLQQEVAAYNEQLLPRYNTSITAKVNFLFKFDEVVEADKDALVTQATKLVDAGVFTRNQALVYIGMEEVEGGDVYVNNTLAPEDDTSEEEIKALKQKTSTIFERLDQMIEEKEEIEFMQKNLKLAEDQEGIMHQSAVSLFQDQFKRTIGYLTKVEKATIRGIFVHKEEVQITKDIFKTSYYKIINNSNEVGNVEIKEKIFKYKSIKEYRVKALSGEAIALIDKKLNRFADEVNDTTRKALRKFVAESTDTKLLTTQVQKLFNDYLDGQKNVDILTQYGFYTENVGLTTEGKVVIASGNRYNSMLESITKAEGRGDITKVEMNKNLKALRGVIDSSDPVGRSVDSLLTNVYNIAKEKGISFSRSQTIARTEAAFARNLGFNDTYKSNPFVTGKIWRSLHDKDTRHAHSQADGQTVKVEQPFIVGGQSMMFPGDDSMNADAENVINCRCRATAKVL